MKIAIHTTSAPHQASAANAMIAGLLRHGETVERGQFDEPISCDAAVIWGWKQKRVIDVAPNVIVMEAGHVWRETEQRLAWTSIGWNGLAGRGKYPEVDDGGKRWRSYFGERLVPWRNGGEYVLLCGQVPGDSALAGFDFNSWTAYVVQELWRESVVFRPHPIVAQRQVVKAPTGAIISKGTLSEDLSRAKRCVTYNSTSAVAAVLSGTPTVTIDKGSMAWAVTSHAYRQSITPDRSDWAARLAWCQWTKQEMLNGTAWEYLKGVSLS